MYPSKAQTFMWDYMEGFLLSGVKLALDIPSPHQLS